MLGILPPIHSVAVAVEGEQLNRALARYKSDGVSQVERFGHTRTLGAMLSLFVERHANCLGEFDAVVAVPSPTRCAPGRIIDNVVALSSRCITPLERVTPKSRSVSRDAYRLTSEVRGTRLLVVDDTFVTGASMFSACHTLRDGGAEIVGCLAVGRQVKTTWSPSAEMLKWLRKVPWDPDRCRVCGGAVPPGSMF